mgnify:FL=1
MTKELYNETYYRRSKKFQCSVLRNESLLKIVMSYNPKRVLDVGCGRGLLVSMLREEGLECFGIDFAPALKEKFWGDLPYFFEADAKSIPFPDKYFDIVVSSDFFEHLPESDIDMAFKEMNRVGNKVIARIPPQAKLTENQQKYHITNQSKEWWQDKLKNSVIVEYD